MKMKQQMRRLAVLGMLLALTVGLLVPAWAAGTEAVAPELSMWDPTSITVRGVDGQEYVIAPKGSGADWSKAVEPEDGFVTFEDLTPATAYVIYTRVKADAGEPRTTELTTDLSSLGFWSETDLIVGAVLNLETEPEDARGLTFQWYHDAITPTDEGAEHHDLTPIDGAAAAVYTVTEADLGKYLAVKVFKDEAEVGSLDSIGPVIDGSDIPEEGACPGDESCPISRFADSNSEAWYHDGVHWALEQGLMTGTGETTFAPGGTATRAMVVAMLWRLEGKPAAGKTASFTDVSADAWYAGAVNWAAEAGAVNGTSAATFSPNAPITREQLATILYRYAQARGQGFTGEWAFLLDAPDADKIADYANEAMHWMVMNGVITGMGDGTLAPRDNATRAQIAAMFQRFSGALEETVSHVFDFDGNKVRVTVDISGGWDAEFGEKATYLYDRPAADSDSDDRDAAAFGVYETRQDYDTFLAEAKAYDDFTLTDNGFAYTDSIDVTHLFFSVGNGVYFRIMVEPGNDAQAVFDRFTVKMV